MAEKSSNYIVTEVRDSFGKGAARKIRAADKIPAVIYGHGTDPQHVTLPGHETSLIIRKANQILELDIQGKTQTALVKDVQRDPVSQLIEHIDLVVVRKGERVQVEVSVHLIGMPASGTMSELDTQRLVLEAPATNIPERVEVDIEGAENGTHFLAKDIALPEGATLITDPEVLVASISLPQAQDLGVVPEVEETEEEAAAEEEAAE